MDTISPQTSSKISEWVSAAALRLEGKVIAWRRDIHQHPELSYHETRTAALAAKHLSALGYEVTTGVGETGVVGVLKGGKPGPVVALRADMDALPVEERVDLPFASKAKAMWQGQMTGVMHACGHDAHVAILMGVAEILAEYRAELTGTVKLLFQPNEEGFERPPERRPGDDRPGRAGEPRAVGRLRAARHLGAGVGRHRLASRRADGERRSPAHQRPWPPDPRLDAVARRRSRGDVGADHPGAADHRHPPDQFHGLAGGAVDLDHPWRRAQQHPARRRHHGRHAARPRRGGAGRHQAPHRKDRDHDRRRRRRHRRGRNRRGRAGDLQRSGADPVGHAEPGRRRRRRAGDGGRAR